MSDLSFENTIIILIKYESIKIYISRSYMKYLMGYYF